jgi:excisionase family DNA binding protein
MAERIRLAEAAEILGVPVRTVQALAARGEIPAAKVGRLWTFNPDRLRSWLQERETMACRSGERRPAPIGAAKPSGRALKSPAVNTGVPWTQMIRGLQRSVAKSGTTS